MADVPQLQFEHAEHAQAPPAALTCAGCGQPIRDQYYEVNGRTLCEACRQQLAGRAEPGIDPDRFVLAFIYGCAAGLAGAALWYAVERLMSLQIGLIAIAVGYLVGRAVHYGSLGRGGWPYQALAVVLTYLSIAVAYVARMAPPGWSPDRGELLDAFVRACGEPFRGGFMAAITLLIIFFGLRQAWRMNQRLELHVSGPYRVGAAPLGGAPAGV